jgi:membrane protein required for colicin V production
LSITNWNGFDWMLFAILVLSTTLAFRRGLVRAIFGLLGFVGGFKVASSYYIQGSDWINELHLIGSVSAARIVAFLLIVALTVAAIELTGWGIQKMLRAAGLSLLDRIMGLLFGFARGCLIDIALLLVVTNFAPQSQMVTTSVLSPYFLALAHDVSFLVPQYLQQRMADGAVDFRQNTPHWINRH